MRILKDLKYDIYYNKENKTVYILPPVKVINLNEIRTYLKYVALDIKNIVVGRIGEVYL